MTRNAHEQRRRASWNIQTQFNLGFIRPVTRQDDRRRAKNAERLNQTTDYRNGYTYHRWV